MKRIFLTFLLMALCAPLAARTQRARYRVTLRSRDNGVTIVDPPQWARSAAVRCQGATLPAQMDDLDGDGRCDEVAFVLTPLPCGPYPVAVEVEVIYSSKPAPEADTTGVNAQMWLKNPDKSLTEVRTASSEKDDMYHRLHHHGPAFESELAAYRIYFDKKQSIDTYGKRRPRLELRRTMWYPDRAEVAAGSGYDNLRVFGSISVGALKGWDSLKGRMTHIVDMQRREAVIRASGPVRTVVDMRVEGWLYGGRRIDMTSRYILFAGHQDVRVENRIEGDLEGLVFTTGVMKIRDGGLATLGDSVLCSWGRDYPENDTLRWQREEVALAVSLPRSQIVSLRDDKQSHLAQLRPTARGRIDYRMAAFWRRNEWIAPQWWADDPALRAGQTLAALHAPLVERLR